jgi:hypothetical protein
MAVSVYEFGGARKVRGTTLQVADGQPLVKHSTTGEKTLGSGTNLIRIVGTGSITWPNEIVEQFTDAEQIRGVRPGTVITLA